MENVNSTPTINSFEPSLKWANQTEKREWLHKHAGHTIDKFVMDGVTDLNSIREEYSAPAPLKWNILAGTQAATESSFT